MPDIGTPLFTPSADLNISDLDLNKVLNRTPVASANPLAPAAAQNTLPIDTGYNTNIKFGEDVSKYAKPLRTFDEAELKNVAGYDSFKSNPSYNPEFSGMQNTRDYAAKQGKWEFTKNLGAKLWDTTIDSAVSTFAQHKRNIDALVNLDLDKLYNTDDNSAQLDELRYKYPTFGTGENDDSWRRFNPFTAGKADFYGEFIPQIGFSIGTMGASLAENAVVGALTGGAGEAAEAVQDMSSMSKLFKGWKNLFETTSGITNFKKAMQVIGTIKDEGSMAANIGQGIIKGAKLLANGYAIYNTAAGEASFEANNTYNDHQKDLIADFVSKNGYQPFGEDLKKIKNSASSAAISTFGWNMPILLASNLVQFGNILKPFKGEVAQTLEKTALELAGKGLGKTVEEIAEKEITSNLGKVFHFGKDFLMEAGSEGLEEISQSAASTYSSQYYKDLYNGLSSGTAVNDGLNSIWQYAHTKAFTDDFVGGFLGGAVFSGIGAISEKTGLQEKLGFDTDATREKAKQAVITNGIDLINNVSNEKLAQWLFKPEVQNFVSQVANKQRMTGAALNEDILGYKDAQNQSVRDLIYAGLKTGKLDVALSKLDVFKELDNDELAQFTNTKDTEKITQAKQRASEIVDDIKQKALSLESDYNTLSLKYKNKYTPGTLGAIAYDQAIRDRLFSKDIVNTDRKRAKDLRADISKSSDGIISDNIINHAADKGSLSSQIEFLEKVVANSVDREAPEYKKQTEQLRILKKMQEERNKKDVNYDTLASHVVSIANLNAKDNYFTDHFSDTTDVQRISDVLKLEERNRLNLAQYNLLNNKPIEESMQEHLQAQAILFDQVRQDNKPAPVQPASAQPAPTVAEQPVSDTPTTSLQKELQDTAPGATGNESDKLASIFAANQAKADAAKAAATKTETPAAGAATPTNTQTPAANTSAVGLLAVAKPTATANIILTPDNETSKQEEIDQNAVFGSKPLASIKVIKDVSPPSEQLAKGNPTDNQFHRRKDQFLENLHLGKLRVPGKKNKFWQKQDLRVTIITPNNFSNFGKNLGNVLTNGFTVTNSPSTTGTIVQKKELGDYGTKVGDINTDGFTALNSNNSSNQDSFAISKDKTLFVVGDGLGSYGESGAASRWITDKIAEEIKDLKDITPEWLTKTIQELQADKRYVNKYAKRSGSTTVNADVPSLGLKAGDHMPAYISTSTEPKGLTTITAARKISDNEYQIYVLGDSPLYRIDKNGKILESYGAETAGSSGVDGYVGFDKGQPRIEGKPVVKTVKVGPGEKIVLGSDYLSDGLQTSLDDYNNLVKEREQWKKEGGYYDIGGKFYAPSELSANSKQKYAKDYIAWSENAETYLENHKKQQTLWNTVFSMSEEELKEELKKLDPATKKIVEEQLKIRNRRLDSFENMSANEFHKETYYKSAKDNWKDDDATVIMLDNDKINKAENNKTTPVQGTAPTSVSQLTTKELEQLDKASIMFLFTREEKGNIYPVAADGTLLPALSPSSEYKIQDLVYSFNEPSTEYSYSADAARYKEGEEPKKFRDIHRNQRLKWLSAQETSHLPFQISHGLPNTLKSNRKINTVKDVSLYPEDHVFAHSDVYIPTTTQKFEEVNTDSMSPRFLRAGRPYARVNNEGGTFEYQRLENFKLTDNQKGAVLAAVKAVGETFSKAATKVELTDSNEHLNFLKHTLFLQTGKQKDVYKNEASLFFKQDTKNGTISLLYDFSATSKEVAIQNIDSDPAFKAWLDNRYFNIQKPTNKPFKEFYLQGKELKERVWDNYTQYLLDNKTPDKSERKEIPLKVELYTPQQQNDIYEGGTKYPTVRKQYYVKLGDSIRDEKNNVVTTTNKATPKKEAAPSEDGFTVVEEKSLAELFAPTAKPQQITSTKIDTLLNRQLSPEELAIVPYITGEKKTPTEYTERKKIGVPVAKLSVEISDKLADKLGFEKKDITVTVATGPETSSRYHFNNKNQGDALNIAYQFTKGKYDSELATLNKPIAAQTESDKLASIISKNTATTTAAVPQSESDKFSAILAKNAAKTAPVATQVAELVDEQPFTTEESKPVEKAPEPAAPKGKLSLRGGKPGSKVYNKLFQVQDNYTPENIAEIKAYFLRNLPQVGLQTTDRLIKLADGKLAWGTFSDKVVTLAEQAIAGTGYHEAFEVVFNALLTPREQQTLLNEFKGRTGTFSNFATKGDTKYSEATDSQAREEMAEEFLRFKTLGEQVQTPHKTFFQKLLDFIKKFIGISTGIEDVFSKLDKGFFANKELRPTDGTFTSQLVNIGPVEQGYLLKGLTYEMINDLFNKTKSFTQFDETFSEKALYDNLYNTAADFYNSQDPGNPNTFYNVILAEAFPQIEEIENSTKPENVKEELISKIEEEAYDKWSKQAEKWNTQIAPQWEAFVIEHKKYLKQLGKISFTAVDSQEEGDENDKSRNEYTQDTFKIDIKNTAPSSIRLLFNTLAESIFDFSTTMSLQDGKVSIPSIQPKLVSSTGLVNLFDGGKELFNIVLNQASEINTLDGIKNKVESILGIDKMEDMSPEEKNAYIQSRLNQESHLPNSIYTHLFKLYARIFSSAEDSLTEGEIKQRLKFLSTFSKQKPEFSSLIISDGEVFLMDELRDKGRKKMISGWMNKFYGRIADRKQTALLYKSSKKPFVVNKDEVRRLGTLRSNPEQFLLQTSAALGIDPINKDFLENLTGNEKNSLYKELNTILEYVAKVNDGQEGKKFTKLTPNNLGVNAPFARIADLILNKNGDESEAIHSNIEGEQQQNVVQNNHISNTLAALNLALTRDEFLAKNPHFKDTYVESSVLLDRFFLPNGRRNPEFNPKITILGGIKQQNRDRGKKSANQTLTERLFQEFNTNLNNVFYILSPADSETEWAINLSQKPYISYTDNTLSDSNLAILSNYLKSEIQSALQFVGEEVYRTNKINLNIERPLRDGTVRAVGASLQIFKEILSDATVAAIHQKIDAQQSVEEIMTALGTDALADIRNYIQARSTETFANLSTAGIVSRQGRTTGEFDTYLEPGDTYTFYGLDTKFAARFPKIVKTTEDGKSVEQKNQYSLSSEQLNNVINHRELNYIINNIEMCKLFFGNPYFYKDMLKRTKSSISPRENTYVQQQGDTHRIDDWFNINKNTVTDGTSTYKLPSGHLHNHEFKSHIAAWVFKDHETLNKELAALNPKYAANNATDAQSFATLNLYREMYWKSGARFRDTQEKQFQIEMAYERLLMHNDDVLPYIDSKLQELDLKLVAPYLKDGELTAKEDVFEIFKPIGSGALGGTETFDPYIWKTSVAPLTYRMVRGTPMQTAYTKMLKEKVDVLTFDSAIKVGLTKDPATGKINSLINTDSFANLGIVDPNLSSYTYQMPFATVGLQLETSTQKSKGTIGTQTTKLITTDMFEYGIPTDWQADNKDWGSKIQQWNDLSEAEKIAQSRHYQLDREHNQAIINLENYGYQELLSKLGIKEITNPNSRRAYQYDSLEKVYELLKDEMVRRGMSPNIYDMFEDVSVKLKPIEALSNYAQASFIIMSIVRKNIIKPKLNGGQKIQASSALLNDLKTEGLEPNFFNKETNTWEPVRDEEHFNELKKNKTKIVVTSNQLKFYSKDENGKTTAMEVMLPNTFRDKLNKSREKKGLPILSDEELLKYLREEQPNLLKGIGFRIPTQALSSIDTFIIKGFLPSYMGDSVVVPSELTTKVGSDFDVDKLNTYLSNFSINDKGMPEYIEPSGSIEEAKAKYAKEWDEKKPKRLDQLQQKKKLLAALDAYVQYMEKEGEGEIDDYTSTRIANYIRKNSEKLDNTLAKYDTDEDAIEAMIDTVQRMDANLSDEALQAELRTQYINKKLRGALENNYFSKIDQILKLDQNFEKMLSPNNSDEFSDTGGLRDKILQAQGKQQKNLKKGYINYAVITDSNALRYSRWSYVLGKKGVGIAALSATNHANSQKIGFQLNMPNPAKMKKWWSEDGKTNLKTRLINFTHNSINIDGRNIPMLSGITKTNGQNIGEFVSKYVNGYVDVAKDPWILDIGASMDVAGIFLLMERLGIDEEQISFFLNQPAIKHYLYIQSQKNSPLLALNPDLKAEMKKQSDEDIYKEVKQIMLGDTKSTYVDNFSLPSLKSAVEKYATYPKLKQFAENSTTTERNFQFRALKQFLMLKDYANYIRSSQTASNHDTANLNSLHLIDDKEKTLEDLYKAPALITSIGGGKLMAQALRDNTFVSNVVDKVQAIDRNFLSKDLFRIQNGMVRRQIRNIMTTLNPGLKWKGENDRREIMDKLTKVVINILALNTTKESGAIINNMNVMKVDNLTKLLKEAQSTIFNTDGSIKEEIKAAPKDLANLGSNKWLNNLTAKPIKQDSAFGFLSVNNKPFNDDFEKQIWLNDYAVLKAIPATRALARTILLSALLQSGAEHNRESYMDLLPWKDYTKPLNNGLDDLDLFTNNMTDIQRTIAQLKAYDKNIVPQVEFFSPAQVNGTAVWPKKVTISYPTSDKKEASALMQLKSPQGFKSRWVEGIDNARDNTKVKEISSVLLIPKDTYTSNNQYFTLKQNSIHLTDEQIKDMVSSSNFDYLSHVLFEKTPISLKNGVQEYDVYRPLNTKGDRYLQEVTMDNLPSQLDTHERVNPDLSDDTLLFNVLKERFKGQVTTTAEQVDESEDRSSFVSTPEEKPVVTEDAIFEVVNDQKALSAPQKQLPTSAVNIYAGTNENAHLSNFATRPFKAGGITYNSVEHAFQDAKFSYATANDFNQSISDKIVASKNPAEAKKLGSQFQGLEAAKWNKDSSSIMKDLIQESFEQNPDALQQLLATGNATLTHTQDKGKWGNEFPKLLMEVRDELTPKSSLSAPEGLPQISQENTTEGTCE